MHFRVRDSVVSLVVVVLANQANLEVSLCEPSALGDLDPIRHFKSRPPRELALNSSFN